MANSPDQQPQTQPLTSEEPSEAQSSLEIETVPDAPKLNRFRVTFSMGDSIEIHNPAATVKDLCAQPGYPQYSLIGTKNSYMDDRLAFRWEGVERVELISGDEGMGEPPNFQDLLSGTNWQPIESMPKDGTVVMLGGVGVDPVVALWDATLNPAGAAVMWYNPEREVYVCLDDDRYTHWSPYRDQPLQGLMLPTPGTAAILVSQYQACVLARMVALALGVANPDTDGAVGVGVLESLAKQLGKESWVDLLNSGQRAGGA